MIKEIIQKGSPILRKKCDLVTDFNNSRNVIQDMLDTIKHIKKTYDFSRGIGLAASQIGELIRIAIIESKRNHYIMINPEIIEHSDEKHNVWEGCLSFFQYRAYVPRYTSVKVKYYNQEGHEKFIECEGDLAASLQHEIDHLDGIIYVDRLKNGDADLILSDKA